MDHPAHRVSIVAHLRDHGVHNAVSAGLVREAAIQHATATPAPPSSRTELEIPEPLEAIVMCCLQKDPADRPQSAKELAADLKGLDIARWTEEEAQRWWKIHQISYD